MLQYHLYKAPSSVVDRLCNHYVTLISHCFFSNFLLLSLISVNPNNPTHSRFIHIACISGKWNYSALYDKRCQDKKVVSVCCFISDFLNKDLLFYSLFVHTLYVPSRCVYALCICRDCDNEKLEKTSDICITVLC